METSPYPSAVTLPPMDKPYPSIAQFLARRFPAVSRAAWETRIAEGKVRDAAGDPLSAQSAYVPLMKLYYFREVAREPVIPLDEKIVFQNDEILVACKPPFLPVVPAGPYVNECLLHRLRTATGNDDLVPVHRIDRETAGVVLFSANRKTRALYHGLFAAGKVEKSYEALAECPHPPPQTEWLVENRIVAGSPWFRQRAVPGTINARSRIRLRTLTGSRGIFELNPLTGKKHQLRIHMSGLGFPIVNDRYYPELQPDGEDDHAQPLQLVARELRFRDPVTAEDMRFRSCRPLLPPGTAAGA